MKANSPGTVRLRGMDAPQGTTGSTKVRQPNLGSQSKAGAEPVTSRSCQGPCNAVDPTPNVEAETKREQLPLVSVVILYYKRRENVEQSIVSVLRQDYGRFEVILVDNHSEDDLREWIRDRAFDVRLVELPRNLGACGGRNAGLRAAKGEIVVLLDDDVSFPSTRELSQVVETFKGHPNFDVLALCVCDPVTSELRIREWCHPRPWRESSRSEFETSWFGEGASALRRRVFDVCGLFYEPLFYGAEGCDLILRILDHGFRILYTPQIRVWHWAAQQGRSAHRQYYYFTRNYLWIAFKDHRFWDGLRFLVPKLLMMSYFTLRTANYGSFLRGVRDGILGLGQICRDRTPISKSTTQYLAAMDRLRPNWMVRLARHRAEPQL